MKKITLLLLMLSGFLWSGLQAQDVILQGFYWNSNPGDLFTNEGGVWWDSVRLAAPELSYAGFKTVWVPPPSKGFAGRFDMGYGIADHFDLGDFDQYGTIRTRHGNRQQLDQMIDALHQEGLSVMADLVLNHRAGASAQEQEDCDGGDGVRDLRFTQFTPASGRNPMQAWDFHPNFTHCDLDPPYHDRIFFEDLCYFNFIDQVLDPAAPNDGWYFGPHNLGRAGDSLIIWGRYMLDEVGFDELRLDAVKHIEPGFLAPFLVEMSNGNQPFAVGELFDNNLATLKGYHDEVEGFVSNFGVGSKDASIGIFDFNLRSALKSMANDGSGGFDMRSLNGSGLKFNPAGGLDGDDIVTFVENHDFDRIGWRQTNCPGGDLKIGSSCLELYTDNGHDPVIRDKHMAYAYIMAAEGRPSVFWKDYFWFGLDKEIRWQMALRATMAKGGSIPLQSLNAFYTQGGDQDFFVINRYGNGSPQEGLVFTLNDNAFNEVSAFVNTPYTNLEMKDYSDAFMFTQTAVFGDGRSLVKAGPRNYAWYAPTGLYPQPAGEPSSAFNLGQHQGGKLHFVVVKAADAQNLLVNAAPIEAGDQIAITAQGSMTAVGLGRVGQSFEWDGVHDMVIEVLGGGNGFEAKGGLVNGDTYDVWVYDKSLDEYVQAGNLNFAANSSNFDFSANRPGSRGGSSPFTLTVNAGANYQVGGISRITAFEGYNCNMTFQTIKTDPSCVGLSDGEILLEATGATRMGYSFDGGSTWTDEAIASQLGAGSYEVLVRDEDNTACLSASQVLTLAPADLSDTDGDGLGDGCDDDDDNDNIPDSLDLYPFDALNNGGGAVISFIWDDLNGNAIQDPGEPGIPGIQVDLINKKGKVKDTQISNADGLVAFFDVALGKRRHLFVHKPALYSFIGQGAGNDNTLDSDIEPKWNAGRSHPFKLLQAGDLQENKDAGLWSPAKVVARIWSDDNGNGLQDTSEPGIPGVTVQVLNKDKNKTVRAVATTDAQGMVSFEDIPANRPQLLFVVRPAGYAYTGQGAGNDDAIDSDIEPVWNAGQSHPFRSTRGGQVFENIDGGLVPQQQARTPIQKASLPEVKVFPNPAQDFVNLEGLSTYDKVLVLDLMGRSIRELVLEDQIDKVKIDLSGISNGIYILDIQGKKGRSMHRISKE